MAKTRDVPEDIQEQIQACIDCVTTREDYCDSVSTPPSEAVRTLITDTYSHPWQQVHEEGKTEWRVTPFMMSGELAGTFLKTLISISNAKRVLEVGLFTGCGALAMAEALPADGTLVTCELSGYFGDLARKWVDQSPDGKKIQIVIGPASESLQKMAKERQQFDIVFVDANKEGYIDYYKIIMDNNMLAPRGTILIDNALYGGQAYMTPENVQFPAGEKHSTVMTEFNNFVYKDNRVSQVLVPIRDGVMMIRRKKEFEGTV